MGSMKEEEFVIEDLGFLEMIESSGNKAQLYNVEALHHTHTHIYN